MYVKSVTLRGFKSFASATTLRLEPGITCIVGPNGSGKSNVVDALAWVMGEQGAKSLRGGKMEDVVFAGTSGRPPLGRAEVSMTIDNTDGALPIDYTEVTITRTMFRNGGSDYAINGTSCRLLDIQELLSDSGIGREMHVIVGQGQLDQVLRATPEERRGFIEEAAGVLKHRKRKERALRKLETMEGNLTRLGDLTSEIRRQLGPLGRQAQTARRAAGIQAEVRDARLRLLADDIVGATTALDDEIKAEALLVERRRRGEEALAAVTATVDLAEQASGAAAPTLSRAQDLFYEASALTERLQSTHDLASERVRLMAAEAGEGQGHSIGRGGRDPEQLMRQAAAVRDEESVLAHRVDDAREVLAQAERARSDAESGHAAEQTRIARLLQAAADRREGLARLAGQVAAQRSRIEAAEAEVGRLREVEAAAVARAQAAEQEFAALEVTITDVEQGEEGLDDAYEKAQERVEAAQAQVAQGQDSLRSAQTRVSSLAARCEALEMSLQRKDGAAALLERPDGAGVEGMLSSLITIRPGHEAQIAAALGWVGDALVMRSMHDGRENLRWLREHERGQGSMIVPTALTSEGSATDGLPDLGPDARADGALWAHEVIEASSPDLARALQQQLRGVALVSAAEQAFALIADHADGEVTAVTRDGDVYGAGWMRGGSSAGPSAIEVASALDQARADASSAGAEVERATFEVHRQAETLAQASAAADAALAQLHHNDADMAAVAEQLGQLGSTIRDARAERDRTQSAIAQALAALTTAQHQVLGLEERLAQAEQAGQAQGQDVPDEATSPIEPTGGGTDL
ncbi:MAG: AAA family ATPase, partial [Ornithinimicrobium sp.]